MPTKANKRRFVIAVTALPIPPLKVPPITRWEKKMVTIRNAGIAALGFALLGFPSAAFAGFKPSAALQSACRSDAFRLCSGSLSSMDGVVACLRAKKSQASVGCRAQYDAETRTAGK